MNWNVRSGCWKGSLKTKFLMPKKKSGKPKPEEPSASSDELMVFFGWGQDWRACTSVSSHCSFSHSSRNLLLKLSI